MIEPYVKNYFFNLSIKTYVVGIQKNDFNETFLWIRKYSPQFYTQKFAK